MGYCPSRVLPGSPSEDGFNIPKRITALQIEHGVFSSVRLTKAYLEAAAEANQAVPNGSTDVCSDNDEVSTFAVTE